MRLRNLSILIFASVMLHAITLASAHASDQKQSEVYTGMVVPSGGGKSVSVKLYVQGATSDEEVRKLAEVLKNGGQDSFVKALSKMDNGRIAPPAGVGSRIAVVRTKKTEKGQRITMITDRPITFPELWKSTRTTQYPVGIVQIDVDGQGRGEGTITVAAKIKFTSDDTIEVESFGLGPSRLTAVRRIN